jgi:superfamily II DNA or RNA helicase
MRCTSAQQGPIAAAVPGSEIAAKPSASEPPAMDRFPPDTKFKYSWRTYQARVLAALDESLDDNRLHVVAAPGSGKTVLGLEVLRRLNRPGLILAPTLTIRDQWVDRLINLFLPPPPNRPDWVSSDLRAPGFLTVATYQALHSAYTGCEDREADEAADREGDDAPEDEPCPKTSDNHADRARALLQHRSIGTVVVDECHHLRTEWWRTLNLLCKDLPQATIVALTATPPFDVTPFEWAHYQALCGPVDAEVPVPELVLAGDLCPHQDYIWFSTPSQDESARIQGFRDRVAAFVDTLNRSADFVSAIEHHPWVADPEGHIEQILDDPEYFSSMLIFLNAVRRRIPGSALKVLGVPGRRLPALNLEWLEILLTACLYRDADNFEQSKPALEPIERELRRIGALERRQVLLRATREIEKALTYSISKLDSIVSIVKLESQALGPALRMVVLTDYIRAADLPQGPDDLKPLTRLGVAPIFEKIRREGAAWIRLGALSGSLAIIPHTAQAALARAAADIGIAADRIHLAPLPHDPAYLRVEIAGAEPSAVVQAMTRLFTAGEITVLVGTKSLLGEGWDAPAMNSLVLASFVGSYMLSNQMRGRAIRTYPANPDKTANIWHLVCVEPDSPMPGTDLDTLVRRFKAFVGVALNEPVIESGIERMAFGPPPYSRERVEAINQAMAARACDRASLKQAWQQALQRGDTSVGTVEELRAPVASLPQGFVFANTIAALLWEALFLGGFVAAHFADQLSNIRTSSFAEYITLMGLALLAGAVVAAPRLFKALWLCLKHGSIESSIQQVGRAVLKTLARMGVVRAPEGQLRVVARKGREGTVYCALEGGSAYERTAYLEALREVLDPIENPRYLLRRRTLLGFLRRTDYHPVPSEIGAKKEFAEYFARMWRWHVGPAELIYARTAEGRRVLLRARMSAMSSAFRPKADRVTCWQ